MLDWLNRNSGALTWLLALATALVAGIWTISTDEAPPAKTAVLEPAGKAGAQPATERISQENPSGDRSSMNVTKGENSAIFNDTTVAGDVTVGDHE